MEFNEFSCSEIFLLSRNPWKRGRKNLVLYYWRLIHELISSFPHLCVNFLVDNLYNCELCKNNLKTCLFIIFLYSSVVITIEEIFHYRSQFSLIKSWHREHFALALSLFLSLTFALCYFYFYSFLLKNFLMIKNRFCD